MFVFPLNYVILLRGVKNSSLVMDPIGSKELLSFRTVAQFIDIVRSKALNRGLNYTLTI